MEFDACFSCGSVLVEIYSFSHKRGILMEQQAFLDFVTEKVDKHTKGSRELFCEALKKDPSKVECWVRKNLDDWKVFAIIMTEKDFAFDDCYFDSMVKIVIEHFQKVFLGPRLI